MYLNFAFQLGLIFNILNKCFHRKNIQKLQRSKSQNVNFRNLGFYNKRNLSVWFFWQHWSKFWVWPLYKLFCKPRAFCTGSDPAAIRTRSVNRSDHGRQIWSQSFLQISRFDLKMTFNLEWPRPKTPLAVTGSRDIQVVSLVQVGSWITVLCVWPWMILKRPPNTLIWLSFKFQDLTLKWPLTLNDLDPTPYIHSRIEGYTCCEFGPDKVKDNRAMCDLEWPWNDLWS